MASEVVNYQDLLLSDSDGNITYALAVHPEVHKQCERDTTLATRMFEVLGKMFPGSSGIKALKNCNKEARPQPPATQETFASSAITSTEVYQVVPDSEWKDQEVCLLVNLRKGMEHLFSGANRKKKHGWQKVAGEMSQHGHNRSSDECERKFRSLINRHKIVSDRRKMSVEGRNPWKHFDLMEKLFGDSPAVTPLSSFATLPSHPSTSSGCHSPSTPSATSAASASASTMMSGDQPETPKSTDTPKSSKRRRLHTEQEPHWMATYREEVKEMHRERMEVERRKLSAIEELIKALRGDK